MKSTLTILVFSCLVILSLQSSFLCNVPGCQYCSYPNSCGLCKNGNVLQFNTTSGGFYCQAVSCPANCGVCYQNNTCQTCSSGHFITANGSCQSQATTNSSIPPNCLWGTNNQTCSLCSYGYTLRVGFCYPTIISNGIDLGRCLVRMTGSICQICYDGYYVNPLGQCQLITINETSCNIQNCAQCSNANSTCTICMPGFQLTSSGTCTNNTCPQTGCMACSSSGKCSACLVGYVLNSQNNTCQLVGYACNDPNCQTCSSSQSCGQCSPGYYLASYPIGSSNPILICRPLRCPYDVQNCKTCSYSYLTNFNYQKVLCTACESGFILVNGYCVANITTYPCSVSNCQSCSFNNFCGQCNPGYTSTLYGACIPTQCNILNCAACSLNNICQQCNNGYSLTQDTLLTIRDGNTLGWTLTKQCVPSTISCGISNCAYCLQNNICAACATGYDFSPSNSNSCVPICNVTNCLQCAESSNNTCTLCKPGFSLQSNGASCKPISFSCGTGCLNTSCIYNWATSQGQCLACQSTYTLYNGACYSKSCNIYGCSVCATWKSTPFCISCDQGLIMANGYCQKTNCNNGVANCAACIQNGPCVGCAEGYLLTNSSGTPSCVAPPSSSSCLVSNCLQCVSGNSTQCSQCAQPYIFKNGMCVCKFQNCLACKQTSLSCDTCPTPLFSALQTGGCIPAPSLKLTCNVANCEYCLSDNKCSLCAEGYKLNPNDYSCSLVNCSSLGLSNCQLCDPYGYSCHLCQTGFMVNNIGEGGKCYPINQGYTCNISGCAVCSSTNNSICVSCLSTYHANGSTQCLPNGCNIANCYMCLQNNFCTVCLTGYYLTTDLTCQPLSSGITNCQGQIPNCAMCFSNIVPGITNYCIRCQDGYQFDTSKSKCIPNSNLIPNCKVQSRWGTNYQPICVACEQGYFINSFGMCSQYNPATNNTGCSVSNCFYCALNSTQCSFCFAPWGVSSNGQCYTSSGCPSNCQVCSNQSTCVTCNSGYTLNNNGVCTLCQITGCVTCNQQNVCAGCSSGYTLTQNGFCISCSVANCQKCSSANYCQTCNSVNGTQLTPSPNGGSCFSCNTSRTNMGNCLSCNATDSCGLCQNGYQLYIPQNSTGVCIQCNIPNCQSCGLNGTTVVCLACALGYSSVGNSCVQCLYPCVTCTANQGPNNCKTCATPFYFLNALSNGSCVLNLIPNCVQYVVANTTLCQSCSPGYEVNSTSNTCVFTCPPNCKSCSSSNVCTTCMPGFYLNTNNSACVQCQVIGCSECTNNGTVCTTCFTGFYLKQKECLTCPGYCASCQGNSSCQSLVQSNQRVLLTVGNDTVLAVCQPNCKSCSNVNPQICLQCQSGFFLNQGNCFKCSLNCLTCSASNTNQCLSCYPNSFLSNGICSTCSSNCLTCQSGNQPSKCLSCPDGYYLSNNACIKGCPLNCITCSGSGTCTKCSSGYTLFNQDNNVLCVPCTTSCRTCAEGEPASCLSCGSGFYLSANTCIQCSINCQTCTVNGCSSCVQGYFLTSLQTCSPNCQLPCSTCSALNPTKCTACIAGYSYNDVSNSCNKIVTCPGGCSACPLGYSLNQGQCTACTASQCQSCNPSNPSQCYSCLPGFYLNPSNSQCTACPSSCATCLTGNGCLTCATGYTTLANVPMGAGGYQCVPCNSPCATCLNTPNYCTSCISGYQFFGWKCAQSFYFGFNVTLLTDLKTFNKNYYNFIQALTSAIKSSNFDTITILGITQGSVVVEGGAGPAGGSGTQQAYNEYSSLDAALSANTQIAGMTIGQSSVTVVGGTVDYKKVNLALILGICIPVGVLLIAGIVLYIYCKKKRSANVIQQKIKEDSGFTVRESFELSSHYRDEETRRPFEQTTGIN